MAKKTTRLNLAQERAVAMMERALRACEREKVYLWDDYGVIGAVNGKHVANLSPDTGDEPLDRDEAYTISSTAWKGSNADDDLYVSWRKQ